MELNMNTTWLTHIGNGSGKYDWKEIMYVLEYKGLTLFRHILNSDNIAVNIYFHRNLEILDLFHTL